ncbi:SMP-30/gluconolactonase/LRE family protein [Adhaeribacter swui]|uniref:SMP-30/gluconolactonase/LRE family protein n=1 Tax=Adhaeribacter swui TaxID=2086471 RepID=A0A7G7G6U5_9BACT|nr:SMP-30/gluconolactonase/LRE family protein [Adhaeribacter swui]QNF32879.1 SMP-30/gluconolactonase/LRE family protein [Adhaeribacter swui]
MKILGFLLALIFISYRSVAQDPFALFTEAREKARQQNYPAYLADLKKVNELLPNYPDFMYELAKAYARNNQVNEALELLKQVNYYRFPFDFRQEPAFKNLAENPAFIELVQQAAVFLKPVRKSTLYLTLPEPAFIPEGITYDGSRRTFYVGSYAQNKIIQVKKDAPVVPFTVAGQDGLGGVLGLKANVKKQELWVCHNTETGTGGVYKYDLTTRKILKKYLLPAPAPGEAHTFNDIALAQDGTAFVTNSSLGAVYQITPQQDSLVRVAEIGRLIYPNGLALSTDERYLYVASFSGILVYDRVVKVLAKLETNNQRRTGGIDGLYFYTQNGLDYLIGIQNAFTVNGESAERIIKITLDPTLKTMTDFEILESLNPQFNTPTTGAIVGDDFYYIANSQVQKVKPGGKIEGTVVPSKVFKLSLK